MPDWLLIVATSAASVVAVVAVGMKGVIAAWFDRRTLRIRRAAYADGFQREIKYRRLMAQLKDTPAVQRVLVFAGRNGGGIPKPGEPYVVTAEDGWSEVPGKHPLETYANDLLVDDDYIHMLETMVREGKVVNVTDEMPRTSALRSYYVDEGVKCSALYFIDIKESDNRLRYLSVASYAGPFTDTDVVQIERCVHQLRALCTS